MAWEGSTCPAAEDHLFARDPTTALTYADLMGVDRVVLTKNTFPDASTKGPPPGWHFVNPSDPLAWVLERTTVRPARPGRVAASPGVSVTRVAPSSDTRESMTVSSTNGGPVIFSRLLWPGYTATLDGRPVPVGSVRGVFVTVNVPAGTQAARLSLSFRPPGTTLGLVLAALGLVLLASLMVLELAFWRPRRPCERTGGCETTTAEPQPRDVGEASVQLEGR
jgi:hypothetical protein